MKSGLLILMAVLAAALTAPELRAQATATATPVTLTFSWQAGGALPAAQVIAVKGSGAATTYTASTPPGDLWVLASPESGKVPGNISVTVNPSTLPPATYSSSVTINVTGVASPIVVPVTLLVTAAAGAAAVTPATVALASNGSLTGTFGIANGPATTTFAITSGAAWLTASPAAGAVLPAQTQTITVTASTAGLNPSATPYAGKLTVVTTTAGVAKTQTVTVNLTVSATPPSINSVWPSQIPPGSPDTVVTIRGANYFTGTTVNAVGAVAALKSTTIDAGDILATIPAALLAAAGTVSLVLTNPFPGGSSQPFVITVGNASTITAVTNAASYATGAVSPGELIAIFGQNIGPEAAGLLTVANGYAATSVGGVTVTIDGQNAPILYAGASQVTVQVPYNARPGTAAQGTARPVVLTYGTATPAQAQLDIVAAAPGVFTAGGTGNGGAALVLNYDPVAQAYSLNSATTPAKVGSTVVFFLTGEGDYASSVYGPETGFIVPLTPPVGGAYPQLNPPPTVTIGGVATAPVAYAGPIPGSILGLVQINAVVPAGATTGVAAPLTVTIGAAQAQANLTISISP